MSTIVETLNIGFVIPLIEMECEMQLTLGQKGILNSAAFVGESRARSATFDSANLPYRLRCRVELTVLGFPRRLASRRETKGHALLYDRRVHLLRYLHVLGSRLDAHRHEIFRWLFVSAAHKLARVSH